MSTTISLVTICHHTKILQYCSVYAPCCTFHLCNFYFVTESLCLLISLIPHPPPLQQTTCLFFISMSLFLFYVLWCWRRFLKVPRTARRSNQSNLKEINPEYSLEGLMLKLKLQDFGHTMWRADSLEKTLMLEKIDAKRRRGRQRMR